MYANISFRISEAVREELEQRAREQGGSIHALARDLCLHALHENPPAAVIDAMGKLELELRRQRADFALAVEAILLLASRGTIQPAEAEAWVTSRLRRALRKDED